MQNISDEIDGEMEKIRDTLAMAERAIDISRKEQERISSNLPAGEPEPAVPPAPPAETL